MLLEGKIEELALIVCVKTSKLVIVPTPWHTAAIALFRSEAILARLRRASFSSSSSLLSSINLRFLFFLDLDVPTVLLLPALP